MSTHIIENPPAQEVPGVSKQSQRRDPWQLVTALILHHLENGVVPWRCPWNRVVGRPRNFHTGKPYQGVNLLLLGCRSFASPYWLTIHQANQLGGRVRKGEHGSIVVKYGRYQRQVEDEGAEPGETRAAFFLKEYTVFNATQIDDETVTHYNLLGQVDWVKDAKGRTSYYYYNDAGQLARLVDTQIPAQEFTWTYDFEGNLLSATHPSATGPKTRYQTWTPRNQISTRTDELNHTEQFFYDAAGNLDHVINADIDGVAVAHDNRGNILTGKLSSASTGSDSLNWDYAGRLIGYSIAGGSGSHTYDGLGHRVQTTQGGVTRRFVIDDSGSLSQVMAETNASGTISAYYLYLGGLAARILPDGSILCYHTDRSGNVCALTDGAGSITDLYQYDEFGFPAGSAGSTANPFRYAGGFGVQTDANGTLFSRARYYLPEHCRFLSRDALLGNQQSGQSLNRYAAFLNDPFTFSDPSGFVAASGVSPSFYTDWKSYIPIYGSWRDAMTAAREGRYWAAAGDSALAISDVFLVKSLATVGIKALVKSGIQTVAEDASENFVYRAVRPDELASIEKGQGILRGNGATTATQQVLGVKHAKNPWVSVTRSLESANFFATHGGTQEAGTIVRIDLSKVTNDILDVSTIESASSILKHPAAINFSAAYQELLINGGIAPEAISIFK